MARARPVEIDPGEPFGEAARRVLGVRAPEMLSYVAPARTGDDIEHLHDLRVGARRLRAVLEVFDGAFPRRAHAAALSEIKRAGEPLGAARDLDVQIAFIETFAAEATKADQPGIAELLERLRVERAGAYAAFGPSLDELESGPFTKLIDRLQTS